MTRKERDKTALRLVMEWFEGEADDFTEDEIRDGVRFALVGGPAPPWWAEVVYDLRSANREHREATAPPQRCAACGGRGWLGVAETEEIA